MSEKTSRTCGKCGADLKNRDYHKCNPSKEKPQLSKIESKTVKAAGFNATMPKTEGDKDKKKKSKKTKT